MTNAAAKFDAIILGAGGAGMMCAATAGQRGRRVLLIDHAREPGRKILISGGGRCNFTNLNTPATRYLSANRHFAKSALGRYEPDKFIALVNAHGIAWHEKTLGQLFCDGSARQIVAMLRDECAKGDVTLKLGDAVSDVTHADGMYRVSTGALAAEAPALVIATGGPSIPKMGATGFAYELAERFGLDVMTPRPALVPLTLSRDEALFQQLSGVSAQVIASCGKMSFRKAALFTHKGLSGPAILQISSYWRAGDRLSLNFLPDLSAEWLLAAKHEMPRATLQSVLAAQLSKRLAEALVERLGQTNHQVLTEQLANLPDKALIEAGQTLCNWQFTPNGSEGFAKAEVTAGGIATSGLSSKNMAAKHLPGLYCIGEAVDVTGWLGGYNFQWAWSSGWAAGQAL